MDKFILITEEEKVEFNRRFVFLNYKDLEKEKYNFIATAASGVGSCPKSVKFEIVDGKLNYIINYKMEKK